MKKTNAQKALIREYGYNPILWNVVSENGHFLHIRNWLTRKHRVCRKEGA